MTVPYSQQEIELLLELGNRLVKLYCRDCVPDITSLTKWTFRDTLIRSIACKWNIPYDQLPGEQTLYRAFREHKYSSATKEKLALFYYAVTDPLVALEVNKEYKPLAGIQRTQSFPYWNRFVKEVTENKGEVQLGVSAEEIERLQQFVSSLNENKKQILLTMLEAGRSKANISVSINRDIEPYDEKKAVA